MSFPRYPKYKDSGVEWLGEVPEGWEGTAIKRLCETITDGAHISPEREGGQFPFVSTKDIGDAGIDFENCFQTSPASYDYMVKTGCQPQPGDVLFSKDGTIGRTLVVGDCREFVVASSLIIIRPKKLELDSRFLSHLCQSDLVRSQVEAAVKGAGLPRLSITSLLKVVGCFPTLSEQTAIAAFLDRETAKIDALVAEQRRLMELLKEKRQAVISHAVTKGLNPDATMKDSGIEWLGEVPEGWEVTPVKAVSKLFGRIGYRGYTTADIVDEGEGAITMSPSNMSGGVVSVEKSTYISWEKYNESPEIMVMPNDIVMVKTGSTFGKVAFVAEVEHPTTINPQLVLFKNVTCFPRFLFLVINTTVIRARIEISNSGSSIPTMTQEAIGNFRFALPPEDEQRSIVEFVDRELSKLSTLTAEAQRAIALLQERRTALISAAVTGQIDVRGLAGTSV
jgi:type I restriction enzyme S subunit